MFDQLEIIGQHRVRHGRDDGDDLVVFELGEESADERLFHGLMHEMNVHQRRRIGDRRMAAIEDTDLHMLIGSDVGHEGHADLFQRRTACREIVLQHPLLKFLAIDGPIVLDVESFLQEVDLARARCRRDAVDHAVRKSDVCGDPVGKGRVGEPRRTDDGSFRDTAIVRNVVARHDGKGRQAGSAARLETGQDEAEYGLRRIRVLAIGDDRRMGGIELARGIDEIAALGDRHRDDADGRVGELGDDGLGIADRQDIDHRRGDARGRAIVILFDHGRQKVLSGQLFPHGGIRR